MDQRAAFGKIKVHFILSIDPPGEIAAPVRNGVRTGRIETGQRRSIWAEPLVDTDFFSMYK